MAEIGQFPGGSMKPGGRKSLGRDVKCRFGAPTGWQGVPHIG
jgi:hypothetical protein